MFPDLKSYFFLKAAKTLEISHFSYLVLEEYRKRHVFLSSSRILLFRNRIETLSKIEQSGWNPTGVGIKGASSAAVKKGKEFVRNILASISKYYSRLWNKHRGTLINF